MAELLCLTSISIVYKYLSETMSAPTYKCHYLVVKALGLADDEEKKFNHRRTKYYYVRNPKEEKGDYFVNFTLNRTVWENENCDLFVSSADG